MMACSSLPERVRSMEGLGRFDCAHECWDIALQALPMMLFDLATCSDVDEECSQGAECTDVREPTDDG